MFLHPSFPRLNFSLILQIQNQEVVLCRCATHFGFGWLSRVLTRGVVVLVGKLEMPWSWSIGARSRAEDAAIKATVVIKGGNEVESKGRLVKVKHVGQGGGWTSEAQDGHSC